MSEINEELDIAVIGMAGRFPGADDINEFWEKLKAGVELIRHFSGEELIEAGVDPKLVQNPRYVKARGIINDADGFDAYFFDYSPHEAEIIDPQHRLFLEKCWEAMEHAGYNAEDYDGLIGLFGGVSMNTNLYGYLADRGKPLDAAEGYQLAIGNDKDFLTTRVSYKMNLRGPSLDVQTACSTSMVAITVACQNLLNYSCDMALAGGVSISMPQEQGYLYQEGMILSPDGHCRAFDAKARGTVSGNGAGVVLLKRISDALTAGDTIHAIIKGTSFNNDGARRVGYTAPGVDGQADVIDAAQFMAEIDPRTISYVETHGTGTEMGDPIEVSALKQVFSQATQDKQFCALGSVKSNIGHLDAASGVAGFIKTVLALENKQIPPSLHYEKPNPQIDFENSPFYVNDKLRNWSSDGPRRAGVSSFGIGGTNVHVVLQEAPKLEKTNHIPCPNLFVLSAKTPSALDTASHNLADHFKNHDGIDPADAAFTLFNGRKHFSQRRFVVASSISDAQTVLEGKEPKRLLGMGHKKNPSQPNVVFLFSGQGAQYVNMGKGLYENETVFKKVIDNCSKILEPHLGQKLTDILYPSPGAEETATRILTETRFTQPALFVIELAIARLWEHYGIKATAMAGHSIGEYVAAHLAGVFSLDSVLKVVAERGRMMQSMPGGRMLSIDIDAHEIDSWLIPGISLATVNTKGACVLSGPEDKITELEHKVMEKGIGCRRLHTSHAFHSEMMGPILEAFKHVVESETLSKPTHDYLSNVSGDWISEEEATSPNYYARHLRGTVRFADNLDHLLEDPQVILLEVGPGKTLASLAKRHSRYGLTHTALASLRHPQDPIEDRIQFLTTAGRLWLAGAKLKASALFPDEKYHRLPLPTYPFERKRYWLHKTSGGNTKPAPADDKQNMVTDWFYTPVWKKTFASLPKRQEADKTIFVFYTGTHEPAFTKKLPSANYVGTGKEFRQENDNHILINPQNESDYRRLLKPLAAADIIFVASKNESVTELFNRLTTLGKALILHPQHDKMHLTVVSHSQFKLIGTERAHLEHGLLNGLLKTLIIECPGLMARLLDLPQTLIEGEIGHLQKMLLSPDWKGTYALRHGRFWQEDYQKIQPVVTAALTEKRTSVLITGGSGNLGALFVEHLASKGTMDFTLVSRSSFPRQDQWNDLSGPLAEKAAIFATAMANGSTITFEQADVSSEPEMHKVFETVNNRLGKIDIVIHAAGLIGEAAFRPIPEIDAESVNAQFKAKVEGFLVLQRLARKFKPKLCLAQSSLAAVLGGLGFGAYAAANAFLSNACTGLEEDIPWRVIDWDGLNFSTDSKQSSSQKYILNRTEALSCMDYIFSDSMPERIIISSGNLKNRLDAVENNRQAETPNPKSNEELYDRPNLPTPYVAAESDLQKEILEVWQKLLGIGKIGIHDDFFDLGGNSLMGTQLISRMRDRFKVDVPVKTLFENPTIAGVAEQIDQARSSAGKQEDMLEDMLNKVENMSAEEIARLLNKTKE